MAMPLQNVYWNWNFLYFLLETRGNKRVSGEKFCCWCMVGLLASSEGVDTCVRYMWH